MTPHGKELEYRVPPEDQGRRLRHLLASRLGISRGLIQRLRDHDKVRLNGQSVYLTQFVNTDDLISVNLDFVEESTVQPEAMNLDVIFEDEDFLVLNKPPGILVHPVGPHTSGTLANGVIHRWQEQGIFSKFRPIHRLDRDTSGLVVVGKNQFAHQALYTQLVARTVQREYLALVQGTLTETEGTIDAPIARKSDSIIERYVAPSGQEAITRYQTIGNWQDLSLLRLRLLTGRTHQIRVHLSYLGHPILGDTLYGGDSTLMQRQALHSFSFGFLHPRSRKEVVFKSPLARDIADVIRRN